VDHLVQYDCKDVIAVVESVANVVEFSAETFDADGEIEGTARLGGSVFGDASGDVLVLGLGEEGLHLAMEGGVVGSVGVVELEGGQAEVGGNGIQWSVRSGSDKMNSFQGQTFKFKFLVVQTFK